MGSYDDTPIESGKNPLVPFAGPQGMSEGSNARVIPPVVAVPGYQMVESSPGAKARVMEVMFGPTWPQRSDA